MLPVKYDLLATHCETLNDILSFKITQASAGTEGSIMPTDPKALVMRKLLLTGLSKVSLLQTGEAVFKFSFIHY